MPIYTCFTENRDSSHLEQTEAENEVMALKEAIASLPYDDGAGPFDEELEWLQNVAGGNIDVTLHPVGHCKNTWLWLEGARYEPQYLTYIVKTDINSD